MIIVRSPLRITLGGGGTDVPTYYVKHGGLCLTAAIDKYVYITLHETFVDDLIVKYSEMERVADASEIRHPIVREALMSEHIDGRGLEIVSVADVQAGTGLGSSSAFTCALLGALRVWQHQDISPRSIAHRAVHIEVERLKEPIGWQDQYISAYGDARMLRFYDQSIMIDKLPISDDVRAAIESNLLLFFTGHTRSASKVLASWPPSEDDLDCVKLLAIKSEAALSNGNLREFASLLSRQWELKRSWSEPNCAINEWYELGMNGGAMGGKLVGAGGGGFLMFYTEEHDRLRTAMQHAGLRELSFKFDTQGTTVVCS